MKKIYHILFAAAGIALPACAAQTQYKVESFNGAPFITENGKPLRNRIVWVAGGCGESLNHPLLKKANVWKETELEFEAPNDLPAIVQLRMGKSAGEIYFSKWEISESESGKVVFSLDTASGKTDKSIAHWCAGFRENPPVKLENTTTDDGERALKLTLGGGKKLEGFHLYVNSIPVEKGKKYKVKLRAKSDAPRPFSTSVYYYDNKFMFVKSDTSIAASTIRHAAKAGVNFVSFEINGVWTKPNEKPDFKYIDSAFGVFLEANPKAKLIPRVRLDPQINKWWRDSHPDDIMKNSDGTLNETYVSVSSPAYRREAAESLRQFIEYCEAHYPDNMAGYHPAGGNSREWFYGGTWHSSFSGYDKNTLAAWRVWLKKKYGTPENLAKAWNCAAPDSFEKIPLPTQAEREAPAYIIDPKTQWKLADLNLFLQDEMADTVLGLAKVIRKSAPNRLSIFFFGYGFEFSGVRNGPAFSGHYALSKILKSPDIDAVSGPISYADRNFGDGKTTMGATESITDSGKLWIDEDDTSTYLAPRDGRDYPGKYSGLYTRKDSREVLRRNLAQETVRNNGVWWMDLFGQGWFDDKNLWREMKSFAKPERDIIARPLPYRPQMRLVMDETSMCMVAAKGAAGITTNRLMALGRVAANRSGVPFGQYLLSDVLAKPEAAKLNAMLSVYALNADQRAACAALREKSANIWAWLPAYIDTDRREFSTSATEEATGFKVKRITAKAAATPTEDGAKIGLKPITGTEYAMPLLSPIPESGDLVLAKFENGSPAIVLRKSGKHPQLFCGVPEIPTELYRHMAELAGAHVYNKQGAVVYANGAYISVVAVEDGEYEIDLGRDGAVYNALSGNKLGNSRTLTLKMKKGDCRFLRLGRGNSDL